MKNTKKIISLILAICLMASLAISASAANTVDASGGTGTSSGTLSSTADGSIGGDPAATKMSVTVPNVLPIAVGTDGTVSTATDAKIINNRAGRWRRLAARTRWHTRRSTATSSASRSRSATAWHRSPITRTPPSRRF